MFSQGPILDTAYLISHHWAGNKKLNTAFEKKKKIKHLTLLVLFSIAYAICILPMESVSDGASVPDRAG